MKVDAQGSLVTRALLSGVGVVRQLRQGTGGSRKYAEAGVSCSGEGRNNEINRGTKEKL